LETENYYPFGLTQAGISSQAAGKMENNLKFNNGNELQSNEFSGGVSLNWYDAGHRSYDPQIGRFLQLDMFSDISYDFTPYAFANDNPMNFNDPSGLETGKPAKTDSTTTPGFENSKGGASNVLTGITVNSTRRYTVAQNLNSYTPDQIDWAVQSLLDNGARPEAIRNWALNNDLLNSETVERIYSATEPWSIKYRANLRSWDDAARKVAEFGVNAAALLIPGSELVEVLAEFREADALAEGAEAIEETAETVQSSEEGGLNLFKHNSAQAKNATGWKSGDRFLKMFDKGSPKLNWKQNSGFLRREMGAGKTIFDSYLKVDGTLQETGGFLNAERSLLQSRGWNFNQFLGGWTPPN